MPISYDKIVQGPVFRFLVGKYQKPMMIHTALIAEQSSTLRNLVGGFMEEAQTGTAIWEDVDEDTFALFAQFVYTGDYTPPSYSMVEDFQTASPHHDISNDLFTYVSTEINTAGEPGLESELELQAIAESASEPEGSVAAWNTKNWKDKKDKKRHQQIVGFHDLIYSSPTPSDFTGLCKPGPNESSSQDCTPVFLGHARLYVLAERYGIENLKAMVLHKLHSTLCQFTPYEARYRDVVELARYAYENTPSRKKMDGLRGLVTRYVATQAKEIAGSEDCLLLVEDGGSFASDLLSMVLESAK